MNKIIKTDFLKSLFFVDNKSINMTTYTDDDKEENMRICRILDMTVSVLVEKVFVAWITVPLIVFGWFSDYQKPQDSIKEES